MIAGTVHWHGQISKIEARPAIECYSLLFRTVNGLGGAWETPVCTENSDSGVLVMQPADHGMRHDVSTPLNRACEWRIVVQRSVRSDFVVIARIGLQHPAQVRLAEYDYVVDAFTTDRPDQSFGECSATASLGQ